MCCVLVRRRQLVVFQPSKRLSAEAALSHPALAGGNTVKATITSAASLLGKVRPSTDEAPPPLAPLDLCQGKQQRHSPDITQTHAPQACRKPVARRQGMSPVAANNLGPSLAPMTGLHGPYDRPTWPL